VSSPLIQTHNLTKTFSRKNDSPVKALDAVNLEVLAGEFLAIVGPSGSGKTTLLNLIGALDYPTSGDVFFDGKSLKSYTKDALADLRREKIGFIFQTFNLLPSLTVVENVESALIHSGLSKKEMAEKAAALLDSFGLAEKANMLPLELSVGQQQKVAIARALVREPVLVLADEPTGEMDPMAGKDITAKLVELNRKSKVAVVVVSHGVFPFPLADRALFLKGGRVVSRAEAGYDEIASLG
jgi:putative ABC transport system ATP-binding protein